MRPYYEVFARGDTSYTLCMSKRIAKIERQTMQRHGYTKVYIKLKKARSRITDY